MVGQLHTLITCHVELALLQLNRRLSGPKISSVHYGKEKSFLVVQSNTGYVDISHSLEDSSICLVLCYVTVLLVFSKTVLKFYAGLLGPNILHVREKPLCFVLNLEIFILYCRFSSDLLS